MSSTNKTRPSHSCLRCHDEAAVAYMALAIAGPGYSLSNSRARSQPRLHA